MKFIRGDIVEVNLSPVKGHEQGNFRPVLVINSVILPGDVSIVLPITSHEKPYPLEVALDSRTHTQGVVLCFQVRTLDLQYRNARFIEKAPADIVNTCADYLRRAVSGVW